MSAKNSERSGGRSGGRAARQALRNAPLKEDVRPIRAGMNGGAYKPLSDIDKSEIFDLLCDSDNVK